MNVIDAVLNLGGQCILYVYLAIFRLTTILRQVRHPISAPLSSAGYHRVHPATDLTAKSTKSV
jgi:hypothetical protein